VTESLATDEHRFTQKRNQSGKQEKRRDYLETMKPRKDKTFPAFLLS